MALILLSAVGGVIWLVVTAQASTWDFRYNLWAPTHLLLRGKSPYDLRPLYEAGNAVWLPMVIGAFLPLGALPLPQASMLWLLANIGAAVGTVWIVAEAKRPSPLVLALALTAIGLYPRTLAHMRLGQFSLLAVLLYLVSALLLQRRRWGWAALAAAVALAKPQLGVLALLGLMVSAYRRQQWRGVFRFGTAVALWCVALTLPLFLLHPAWIPDFLQALRQNPDWVQPSLFSMLPLWFGPAGLIGWGLLFLLALILNVWLWWKRPFLEAMCWSLALTPLVSPYIWSWDFVLLLPLFVRGLFHFRRPAARLLLIGGYLFNWWALVRVTLTSDGSEQFFWWGSWLLIWVVLLGMWVEGRFSAQEAAGS